MRKTSKTIVNRSNYNRSHLLPNKVLRSALGGMLLAPLLLNPTSAFGASPPISVTLAWNPSSTAAVNAYRISYGSVSRIYTDSIVVENVTTSTLTDLPKGATYFAITAISSNGLESGLSAEISFLPGPPVLLPRVAGVLTVKATTGFSYEIEASSNLTDWAPIGTVVIGPSGMVDFTDQNSLDFTKRFYRTRYSQP